MTTKRVIVVFSLLIATINFSCKKATDDPQPATANYDAANNIFRTYANANSSLINVTITQIRPSLSTKPFGSVQSQLYSKFDYGFTPAVGDSINVSVNSTSQMYVAITYAGETLPVTTQKTSDGGATVSFGYVVK